MKEKKIEDCIQVVPYDARWPQIFAKEKLCVERALKVNCVAVYHIGSTAVPGLSAKPKIDIMAVVHDFSLLDIDALAEAGFENRGEVIPSGRYFVKPQSNRIHLHIFEEGNPLIEKNLIFRDWLKAHPEDREAYAELKQKIALQYHKDDGMAYCRAKTAFIEGVIKKARSL